MKYLDITLEVLLNSLILSFVAAMIRILFSKIEKFKDSISIFIGSILLGVLLGYILNDYQKLKPFLKIIIVFASIFGKELFIWVKNFIQKTDLSKLLELFAALKSIKIGVTTKKEDNDVN